MAPVGRKRFGFGPIALEQIPHHALGIGHDANDTLMPVHAGEKEGAQTIEVAAHLLGKGDNGVRGEAHIGGAPWLERSKPPPMGKWSPASRTGHGARSRTD